MEFQVNLECVKHKMIADLCQLDLLPIESLNDFYQNYKTRCRHQAAKIIQGYLL